MFRYNKPKVKFIHSANHTKQHRKQLYYLTRTKDDSFFKLECIEYEIMWNANLMQQGNFIDVFLARHVSGTYAHHQEH